MSEESLDALVPCEGAHTDMAEEPTIEGLSSVQQLALRRLTSGSTIVAAARSAGVDRRTLHSWIKSDPDFAAAYNAWQQEVIASGRTRVLAMSNKSLDIVQAAMEKGDTRIAMQIAKSTGLLDTPRPGPTSAPELSRRQNLRARRLALKREEVENVVERGQLFARVSRPQYPVSQVIRCLDILLGRYRDALAAETPEERAVRVHKYDPLDRTYRLADLLLSDPAFQPPAAPEATGGVVAPSESAASRSDAARPPGSPPDRSDNPDQPRATSSGTGIDSPRAKVSNPYNPDAYDPLEDEP